MIKEQILDAIEQRHTNERAYQIALDDWRAATSAPENHPAWLQVYANALQDTLRKTNARRKEMLEQMTVESWRIAVGREMRADMWYQNVEPDSGSPLSFSHAVEAVTAGSNGNGNHPKVSTAAV